MSVPTRQTRIICDGLVCRESYLVEITGLSILVSGLQISICIMEAITYKKEESLRKFNGKPVVDGRFVLVMKNPVTGFIRRVLITGSRGSVYSAVLSFARDQWLPPETVEYSVVNTRLPAVHVQLKGSRKAASLAD